MTTLFNLIRERRRYSSNVIEGGELTITIKLSGYCPVRKEELSIEIQYCSVSVLGKIITDKDFKKLGYMCIYEPNDVQCPRCPIYENAPDEPE